MKKVFYYLFLIISVLLVCLISFDRDSKYGLVIGVVQITMWVSLLLHAMCVSKTDEKKGISKYIGIILISITILLTTLNTMRLYF